MNMVFVADAPSTPVGGDGGGSPPQGDAKVDDSGFIDSLIAAVKTGAQTASQLPGQILDKGDAILDKAGETLGGIVDAVIPRDPKQAEARINAFDKLWRLLDPDRFQKRNDTAGQGDISWEDAKALMGLIPGLGGGDSKGGTSALSMGAAPGAGKPRSTNWPLILGLGAVVGGLAWVVARNR